MPTPRFFITDVFSAEKYAGNQLATFLDCEGISDEEMQLIAREMNFSETTFILSREPRDGGYDVRIFTPAAEVDFAGHPTLGTAYLIRRHLTDGSPSKITLNLKVGPIPVEFQEGLLWMQQIEPVFGDAPDAGFMAEVLSLQPAQIDNRFPIMGVSTGLPFTIVPLRDQEALQAARVNPDLYRQFLKQAWAKGLVVFCPEGYEKAQSLGVRVFVDYLGVPEDPATGSGNGCLAGYLVRQRYFGAAEIDIHTGQGYEIGRPSELCLRAAEQAGKIRISVGGRVIQVAQGIWE
jgi:trans-2,3-dihydro-3-hydroxyanthranilate isomerase